MFVEINNLDSIGQVNDVAPYLLPPEAFTVLTNVRFDARGIYVTLGWRETMIPTAGSRMWDPHYALPVKTPSETFWIYTSLSKAAVFDGLDDHDITNVSGDYVTSETNQWNGGLLGGVPFLNNGVDVPQHWSDVGNVTQKLTDLPGWPVGQTAKIMRSYGPFLVALNVTDSGGTFPGLVHWSSAADPGTMPTSWNYSDPTVEAGRKDLPDTASGAILEAMQLQDTLFIYKERSVWKMRFVGGRYIMDFGSGPWLENIGILGPRCVTQVGDGLRHCFAANEDIIVHNGNKQESVLFERQRESLFANINRETAYKSFMFTVGQKNEVWFCYPETGQDEPNRALVWNYGKGIGAISFVDGITFRNATRGDIEGSTPEIWDTGTDSWDEDTGSWGEVFREQIILSDPTASMLFQLDRGSLKNDLDYEPTIIRLGQSILGRDRKGNWITDVHTYKMVDSIWPKADGAPFRMRVGFQELLNGPTVWQPYMDFDPAVDKYVNPFSDETLPGSGVAFGIEFSATTATQWRLDGYKLDVIPVGNF